MLKIYEVGKKRYEIAKNYKQYLQPIKQACLELLPDAELFLFGSALRNELVAESDIDILIVTNETLNNQRERATIAIGIEDKIGLPFVHPFEFHIMTNPEYKKFLALTKTFMEKI
ncbi:MAG: nucleotidyltransferase domain-containing protein [Candidatus Thorarchaeota archaeon]